MPNRQTPNLQAWIISFLLFQLILNFVNYFQKLDNSKSSVNLHAVTRSVVQNWQMPRKERNMNNSVHFQVSNVNFQKNPCKFKKPFTKLQLIQHYQNQRNRFYDGKITENEFWNKALVIMSKICKAKSKPKTLKNIM